jgi:SAM-dependent methyltransferase
MLAHARRAVKEEKLEERIELVRGVLPNAVPGERTFDAVISNSLLHHLHEPSALWTEARKLAKRGAPIFVVDLMRPASTAEVTRLVELYSANERPVLKQDFYNSLHAAFTIEEVRAQLERAGLGELEVEAISDRHLRIAGIKR